MKQVPVHQATKELDGLIDAALHGEDVVVRRDDHSAVRLVPVIQPPSQKKPQFGSAKGLITINDDFDAPGGDRI